MRERIEGVREACRGAGRDPDELVYSHAVTVCCAEDEAELARRAARIGRDVEDLRRSRRSRHPAGGGRAAVASTATPVRARSYLQVIDLDDIDHVALIAAAVVPLLSGG